MPISFLNDPNLSDLTTSRPTGFKFPTGLSIASQGPTSVDYLIVAGGGGGGSMHAGGGGAGGYLTGSGTSVTPSTSYSVVVGGGGPGGPLTGDQRGINGSDSSALSLTAVGGGGGGSYDVPRNRTAGKSGGSGGGSA